jgi:excisionase family DNA binding protein
MASHTESGVSSTTAASNPVNANVRLRGPTEAATTLWTASDVASYLKVSRSMVYKLGQTGELPCLHVGACLRFDAEVVRGFARGELRGKPGGGLVRLGARPNPAPGSLPR